MHIKKVPPCSAGPWVSRPLLCLDRFDVRRLGTLLALSEGVFDRLAFLQRPETLCRDFGVMNKHVLTAVVGDDKTKTLLLVKPFYFACSHLFLLENHYY